MIPLFPEYKLLSLEDKTEIEAFCQPFPPYADYNVASLWSYNTENDAQISMLHDNLVLRFRDYVTNEAFYSFFGTKNVVETASVLLDAASKERYLPKLQLIPEITIQTSTAWDGFLVSEDKGNFDYILSAREMSELTGSKYHTHKNHINRFHRLYPETRCKVLDPAEKKTREHIEDVFDRWEKGKGQTRKETLHEFIALNRLLDASSSFKLLILGLFINNSLIGFSITDLERKDYAQNHFAKSDPAYKEVYYKMNQLLGIELIQRGVTFLNIENDLDLPGLRFAKEQWNPVEYLKKYTISRI